MSDRVRCPKCASICEGGKHGVKVAYCPDCDYSIGESEYEVVEEEGDLKTLARAVVEWMPGWEWVHWTDRGEEWMIDITDGRAIDRLDGTVVKWQTLIRDRNLVHDVLVEIADSHVYDEYAKGLNDLVKEQTPLEKRAFTGLLLSPETCLRAFARTDPIQEILEEIEDG